MRKAGDTTRSMQDNPFFQNKTTFLKTLFFRQLLIEWNNLDQNRRNSSSLNTFRNSILKFIRPSAKNMFLTGIILKQLDLPQDYASI